MSVPWTERTGIPDGHAVGRSPVDPELAREWSLDAAEDAGGEALGRWVAGDDAQRFLKLLDPAPVTQEGGVLVAEGFVLAEEPAVLLLQPVEVAHIAEEVGNGTRDRRHATFDGAGGAQEDILQGIEETGPPHDGEQDGKGEHCPDPVGVATENQHAATGSRLPPRPSRVELLLHGAARLDLVEDGSRPADHAEEGILGDVHGEAGFLADAAIKSPQQRPTAGQRDAVGDEVAD